MSDAEHTIASGLLLAAHLGGDAAVEFKNVGH